MSNVDKALADIAHARNELINSLCKDIHTLCYGPLQCPDFSQFDTCLDRHLVAVEGLAKCEKVLLSYCKTKPVNDPIAADVERILRLPIFPNTADRAKPENKA